MATTNHERVGKAMELLKAGLGPFVDREIKSAVKMGSLSPQVVKGFIEDPLLASKPITDWDAYKTELDLRLGHENMLLRGMTQRAKMDPKRIVFAEGTNLKILKAANEVCHEGIAKPILLGDVDQIRQIIAENNLDCSDVTIIDPRSKDEPDCSKSCLEQI